MSGLTLEAIAVARGRRQVLAPLTAGFAPGQIVGVVGPNGAGKSTLLQALAGLLPHRGRMLWNGAALMPRQIGFLPQAFMVRAQLSVLECVLLGRREHLGWRVAECDRAAALAMLDRVGIAALAARRMDTLSGGQQQLVLLAQRLLREPVLLILDEPTSALDMHHQIAVLRHLQGHVRASGGLVLAALHDLTMAARFCDGLLMLCDGALVAGGPPDEVLTAEALARVYRITPEILRARDRGKVIVPH